MALYSCVVDDNPKFKNQALIFVHTLVGLAKVEPEQIVLNIIEGIPEAEIGVFRQFGVHVTVARPFDPRHPHSNKLIQLENPLLHRPDHVVLCDCDIAFAGNISEWIAGDKLRAKPVDRANPPIELWRDILSVAGFGADFPTVKTTHEDAETYANNFNGGLYIIPQKVFQQLRKVWPKWNRWLLDRRELLGRFARNTDQVSLGLALASLGQVGDPLPVGLNFPAQLPVPEDAGLDTPPPVIHYHKRRDERGYLGTTNVPLVDQSIARINLVIDGNKAHGFDSFPFPVTRRKKRFKNRVRQWFNL